MPHKLWAIIEKKKDWCCEKCLWLLFCRVGLLCGHFSCKALIDVASMFTLRGHQFTTSIKNHVFDPPSLCPHASTWAGPPSPSCGRPHTVDMKYTLLS